MTITTISTATTYGSSLDPSFTTTCRHEAEAFEFVHSLSAEIRQRLHSSGRFTSDTRLDGAHRTLLADLVWFETQRRRETPVDYYGMDLSGPESPPVTVPASQIGLVGDRAMWDRTPPPMEAFMDGLHDVGAPIPDTLEEQTAAVGAQA
jgi:hypothetical protein